MSDSVTNDDKMIFVLIFNRFGIRPYDDILYNHMKKCTDRVSSTGNKTILKFIIEEE